MGEDGAWRSRAECRGHSNPDLWFPARNGSPEAAKRICRSCPVRKACLDDAILRGEWQGIWGGFPIRMRVRIKNDRRAGRWFAISHYDKLEDARRMGRPPRAA